MASATFDTLKFDGKFRESEQRLLAKIDQNKIELTAKIDQTKTDLLAKIEQLRFELIGRIEQLNSKIDMIHTKLSGDMILVRRADFINPRGSLRRPSV